MEWLTTYDRFSSAMFFDGDFSLNQYLPYTLVSFYPLFQEKGGERVERNQADWEVRNCSWRLPAFFHVKLASSSDKKQRRDIQISISVSAIHSGSVWW